jgi:hypothetical protein
MLAIPQYRFQTWPATVMFCNTVHPPKVSGQVLSHWQKLFFGWYENSKMNTHFHLHNEMLDDILSDARQGGNKVYFYDLLNKIENNSKEWIFQQIQSKLSLEQHESLIRRKHDLIDFIKKVLSEAE